MAILKGELRTKYLEAAVGVTQKGRKTALLNKDFIATFCCSELKQTKAIVLTQTFLIKCYFRVGYSFSCAV